MNKPPLGAISVRRGALLAGVMAAALACAPVASAQQLVPADFFSRIPSGSGGDMAVSADTMVFNSRDDTVVAQGRVGISFQGFRASADRAIYYQRSGRVELVGNVAVIDPEGIEYVAERVELEDGFREGFLRALTVAFPDGSRFTAAETNFDEGVERVYVEGTYAPCGTCIDEKGNRIGWSVKAARIVTDETEQVIYFEQPSLQLLGFSVLSLPWLTLPQGEQVEFPVLSYDEKYGVAVSLPFFRYRIADGSLAVTPTLYSNQGAGLALDWRQTVGDVSYRVSASGVYQFNPGVYSGLANRAMRGAVQTSGTFTPTDEWTLGWSYTAFTDPGFLPDYDIASGTERNEVYAQYLDTDTFADVRVQQFVRLGNRSNQAAFENVLDQQALTHPNAVIDHVVDLEGDAGRVELSGRLLGLTRALDDTGHGFVHGYEGQSVHAMVQASWTNQHVMPGGILVSPYLGLRGDAASYDGASPDASAPAGQSLFSATPIAALDIRYPLLARANGATHVIEPIAQLVYREGEAVPGIVNNDSQGFVFDDSNLFSFNRFSGADRQETGLRANVGGQFQTSFDNGGWLSGLMGQSFHLAGTNSFNVTDGSTAGIASGMNADASYLVAGLQGGYGGLAGGAKMQFDPASGDIPRLQLSASGEVEGVRVSGDYVFIAAQPQLNQVRDRHEIGVDAEIPVADYWTANAGVAWDLEASQWLEATAGLTYDDRFLAYGVQALWTGPTHHTADDLRVKVNLSLSGPGNDEVIDFGYGYQF
ncbi:LPS-assembly protein LptD [Pelagibacterium halotolerans]|uniref:LPS-assembly protein LptD n=1 Tax=Pelagibacterium halotolerans (strain DSM 22347 / JCM 15775 / CGMCC 1.7692 / B2) TaxID=1082931 RepID=G4RGK1_PELHB|nr:LPS assembly protein LptD [Pelagibacterium halotolerans]AEQ51060.1 organic solvent tolerance protein precursor [Pelagibacterium halotolerans B2]QJR19056.1 LPS-assembly protein LptD [Pelagibacterium halotolerans]SEA03687.1 LPS-assembly protein [Pelagibacterium halotolerans]